MYVYLSLILNLEIYVCIYLHIFVERGASRSETLFICVPRRIHYSNLFNFLFSKKKNYLTQFRRRERICNPRLNLIQDVTR